MRLEEADLHRFPPKLWERHFSDTALESSVYTHTGEWTVIVEEVLLHCCPLKLVSRHKKLIWFTNIILDKLLPSGLDCNGADRLYLNSIFTLILAHFTHKKTTLKSNLD